MGKITGRPSAYRPEFAEQARKLCLLGLTDKELASYFQVSEQTLNAWKKRQPDFLEALKAKDIADAEVVDRLYARTAIDTTACIFWLKNRQKAAWRDKVDHEITGKDGGPVAVKVVPDSIMEMIRGNDENGEE